jgi:uncharacterized protein involved in outer membrane biogenesis
MRAARIFGWIVVTLLALITLLIVILLSIDLSKYREPLQTAISSAIDRQVRFTGLSLQLSPGPGIVLRNVSVANPSWASRDDLARAKRVHLRPLLWPLLTGRLQIADLAIEGLDVLLEKGANGADNWSFGEAKGQTPIAPVVESLSCEQCVIAYRSDTDHVQRVSISAAAGVLAADQPVQLLLSGSYRDVAFNLSLLGGTLSELIATTKQWPIEGKLRALGATLGVSGEVLREQAQLRFTLSGEQVSKLATLLEVALPAFGPYELSGQLTRSGERFELSKLAARLGKEEATDRVVVNTGSISLAADTPFELKLEGQYGDVPFEAYASGPTLNRLMDPTRPWPISFTAAAANAKLDVTGDITDPMRLHVDVRAKVIGKKFADLAPFLGMSLPTLGPYALSSRLVRGDGGYTVTELAGYAGALKTHQRVEIRDGTLFLREAEPVRLKLEGTYGGTPLRLSLTGGDGAELLKSSAPWPIMFSANGAGAALVMKGTVAPASAGKRFDLRFDLKGRQLARLAPLIGSELPPIESYRLSGRIRDHEHGYGITALQVNVDSTDLTGSVSISHSGLRPKLKAKLVSQTFDLEQLTALASDVPVNGVESVGLDRPLPTGIVRSADADLDLDIKRLIGVPTPVAELLLKVDLVAGKGTVTIAHMSVPGAEVHGEMRLDASTESPNIVLNLSTKGVELAKAFHAFAGMQHIEGADNKLDLHLTSRGATPRELLQHADLKLVAEDVEFNYQRQADAMPIPVKVTFAEATTSRGEPIKVRFDGTFRQVPIKMNFTGDTLANLMTGAKTWPLDLDLQAADTMLTIKGVATQPLRGEGFDAEFSLRGKELNALGPLFATKLPEFGPYELTGHFTNGGGMHHVSPLRFSVDGHGAEGEIKLLTAESRPRIVARLDAGRIDLDQLAAKLNKETGVKPRAAAEGGLIIPNLTIPSAWLEKFNLELNANVPDVLTESVDVGDLDIKVSVENGRLDMPVQAILFGGRASGRLELDNKEHRARLRLMVRNLDYGRWLKVWRISNAVKGRVDLALDLSGHGSTLQELLANANGAAVFASGPMHLSDTDFGIWGAGLTSGLLSITTGALGLKKSTEFNCIVWPFNVSNGVASSEAILMDTSKLTITGDGTVNLATEKLNIVLKPARKKASIFSFENPVRIEGTLANIKQTTLGKGKTAGKIGLIVWQPYLLLLTARPGTGETNACIAALAGEVPAQVKKKMKKKGKEIDLGLAGELLKELQVPKDTSLNPQKKNP